MFDIGFLELVLIGVVALIVIGPERLPEVAAKVGKTVAKLQRFVRGVRSDISRELEAGDLKQLLGDQKDQIEELRKMVHSAAKDVKESTGSVLKEAEDSFKDAEKSFKGIKDSSSGSATSTSNSTDTAIENKSTVETQAGDVKNQQV